MQCSCEYHGDRHCSSNRDMDSNMPGGCGETKDVYLSDTIGNNNLPEKNMISPTALRDTLVEMCREDQPVCPFSTCLGKGDTNTCPQPPGGVSGNHHATKEQKETSLRKISSLAIPNMDNLDGEKTTSTRLTIENITDAIAVVLLPSVSTRSVSSYYLNLQRKMIT